jgi:RNA polymerase sigma-70 factor (ECF subfamily)
VAEPKFEDFYRAEFKPLIWFAARVGASDAEAEDVAQEAMKATWTRWSEVGNPRAYARTAALRVLFRAHGRTKREQDAALRAAWPDRAEGPFEADAQRVVRMLHALPITQRQVIALVMDGYPPAEIAVITGQKPATVRSHLRHARKSLIVMISDRDGREAPHGT